MIGNYEKVCLNYELNDLHKYSQMTRRTLIAWLFLSIMFGTWRVILLVRARLAIPIATPGTRNILDFLKNKLAPIPSERRQQKFPFFKMVRKRWALFFYKAIHVLNGTHQL